MSMMSPSVPHDERGRRRDVVLAVALACILRTVMGVVPARAQSEPVALEWNAPAGCSSARDVLDRVRRLTKFARLPERQLRAEATVAPRDRGKLHLSLVIRAGGLTAQRTIAGITCEGLAGATAVVLALLLGSEEPLKGGEVDSAEGPDARSTGPSTSDSSGTAAQRSDAARASDDPEPQAAAVLANERRAHPRRRWRAVLQLPTGSLGIGPLPGLSFSAWVGGGVVRDRWSLVAESGAWLSQTLQAANDPDSEATVRRFEVALRSCLAFPLSRWEVAPCVRAAVHHLVARGTGVHIAAQDAGATFASVGVGVQARYRFSQWIGVFSGVDASAHTARPRISIDGVGRVGQLGLLAFTIRVGPEWIF